MKRLRKIFALGSFAMASAFSPIPAQADNPEQTEIKQSVQKPDTFAIVNTAGDPTFAELFKNQLKIMAGTKVGAAVLNDIPKDIKYIIKEKPEYAEEAAFWDGENCTVYDETLISATCGPATLIAHEMRHAIQWKKYMQEYDNMPTEQQIIHTKMTEIETRLQDVLMKEELYNQKALGTQTYEFASADWQDYRRLRASIRKANPTLSDEQVERMARTQFVIDSWQGNHQKKVYDQMNDGRTLKAWTRTYNEKALQSGNRRCLAVRPQPDLTVDESKVARHHEIMQEYIQRMGIDVPADFFDTLDHDRSLKVIRDPKKLADFEKHFGKKVKMVITPRDNFVRVGGIVVCKDNSTVMFGPDQKKQLVKQDSPITLDNGVQKGSR